MEILIICDCWICNQICSDKKRNINWFLYKYSILVIRSESTSKSIWLECLIKIISLIKRDKVSRKYVSPIHFISISIDFVAIELPRNINLLSHKDKISPSIISTRNRLENNSDWAIWVNDVAKINVRNNYTKLDF